MSQMSALRVRCLLKAARGLADGKSVHLCYDRIHDRLPALTTYTQTYTLHGHIYLFH